MNNLVISKMSLNDVEKVKKLEEEQGVNILSINSMKEDLKNNCYHFFLAKINNEIVGYVSFSKVVDEVNILSIVTKKEYQRQGIATSLLNYIFNLKGVKRVLLEVRKSNKKAITLYEKLGFSYYYTRKKYYENKEDAIVYEKIVSKGHP